MQAGGWWRSKREGKTRGRSLPLEAHDRVKLRWRLGPGLHRAFFFCFLSRAKADGGRAAYRREGESVRVCVARFL